MASITREVLTYFDQTEVSVSLATLAEKLHITPGVLDGILTHLVRKGELREIVIDGKACNSCNIKSGCPFVTTLPRYYERVQSRRCESEICCQGCDVS